MIHVCASNKHTKKLKTFLGQTNYYAFDIFQKVVFLFGDLHRTSKHKLMSWMQIMQKSVG